MADILFTIFGAVSLLFSQRMSLQLPATLNASITPAPLLLKDARSLLYTPYMPMEAGYALNSDGMYHVAASTYMKDVSGPMVDWWFGWVTNTTQYKLWHPKDHVSSEWSGPHGNGVYIGGHHLVREYIGGELQTLRISFKDPGVYFGQDWKQEFKANNYSTAICGTVGLWTGPGISAFQIGHLVHLVRNEFNGIRMRSRFWLGDISLLPSKELRASVVPQAMVKGLVKHTTEEMAILGTILPDLYQKEREKGNLLKKETNVYVDEDVEKQKSSLNDEN
jgi:hypothetical protein